MHRQGLYRRPQNNLAFLTSESESPKKWFAIVLKNRRMRGMLARGLIDLQNKLDGPLGTTGCIDKVLKEVHKKNWHL